MAEGPDVFSVAAWVCLCLGWPYSVRLAGRGAGRLPWIVWVTAWIGGLALQLGSGPAAAAVAAVAGIGALYGLAFGVGRFLQRDPREASTWAEAVWAAGPVVAAVAWSWSRYDHTFAGFPEPLATLTVAHFTVTFGLLPAAMAAWNREWQGAAGARLREIGTWGIVALPPLTGLLFALRSEALVPSLAEVGLTAGMAASLSLWWAGAQARAREQARVQLVALPLVSGVWLGAGYAAAQHFSWPWLDYIGMLGWHGAGNLICCMALIGMVPVVDREVPIPAPDPGPRLDPGEEATALFVDHRHRPLGPWSPAAFAAAREALLGYRFYPPDVMRRRTQFEEEGRPARVGDRIGLGLLLPSLPGLPPIQLPAVSEVYALEDGPERVAFGYATTTAHYGEGRWRADVVREGDRLELYVYSHIRPSRWYVWLGLPVYRYFQSRAFHRGADALQAKVWAVNNPSST